MIIPSKISIAIRSKEVSKPKKGKFDCPTGSYVYTSYCYYTKGRKDVDFPLDDYFMALAVLATVRSPYPELVCMTESTE